MKNSLELMKESKGQESEGLRGFPGKTDNNFYDTIVFSCVSLVGYFANLIKPRFCKLHENET